MKTPREELSELLFMATGYDIALIERLVARVGATIEYPQDYDPVISNLRLAIEAGFNGGEVLSMAADLFPKVYNEVVLGQTRSQLISEILAAAQRTDRIADVIDYVRRYRRNQYDKYLKNE